MKNFIPLSFLFYILIIFIKFHFSYGDNDKYCDESLCRFGQHHIGCGNDGKISSKCAATSKFIVMNDSLKKLILDRHNKHRNEIALGELKGYEPAVRMPTMVWNDELATLAGFNVKTCEFRHDSCRNTKEFKFSGQNLGYYASNWPKSLEEIIVELIDRWYGEYKDADMSIIKSFHTNGKKIGHFTVMVSDRSTETGCAVLEIRGGFLIKFLFACNYSSTNVVNFKIYTAGTAASKCVKGVNDKYKGLCHPSEPIDPNKLR